jgi:predicted amidohydrolase
MPPLRIALANLSYPGTPDDSVVAAREAISEAARQNAQIICFPECFVPGYRRPGTTMPAPDAAFLQQSCTTLCAAAARARITVILGTERLHQHRLLATALVINPDGTTAGFQDKLQLDPSEESTYSPGSQRRRHTFQAEACVFGVVICHEGWRYPETVRNAVRQGAQIVFHPHFHEATPGSYRPHHFADPSNTFHEKAALCRAAENTCYFATVNYASPGAPTTSAVISPDGSLLTHQPYGAVGLLLADLDLSQATRLLALRYRP